MPRQTTYANAVANLAGLCDQVTADRDVVLISRRGADDVALVAASELSGLFETAHLLRSPKNARRLMTDLYLDPRYPHHRSGAVTRGGLARRYIQFTVFGDQRPKTGKRWHEHRVQLVTSGEPLRE